MKYFNKMRKAFKHPLVTFRMILIIFLGKLSPLISDKLYIPLKFRLRMGQWPDLDDPQTFNEKLQWLKLYNRRSEYTMMVDKVKVKEYIAKKIGEEYIIPTLGVWDDPDNIDFDKLPNQFVLKCNHNSGFGMCICKDKSKLNIKKVKAKLRKGLKQDYFLASREWPYKNVERKILAEKFMVDESGTELKDYKLMCFHGKVKCCFVCSERYNENSLKVTFYDKEWNRLPFERHYPSSATEIKMPSKYHEMIRLAEKLSENIPFLRSDFYEINGRLYFGELTFFPGSGLEEFTPEEWDKRLGHFIMLPD